MISDIEREFLRNIGRKGGFARAKKLKPMTDIERFTKIMGLVEKTLTCWMWQGTVKPSRGINRYYGQITINGRKIRAHRAVYEMIRGPIPRDLELDHLCRVLLCVNPAHLEAVTHKVNMERSTRWK